MHPKKPFDRCARVGAEIRHTIANICRERIESGRFEHLEITHVKVTKDLRLARVYYFVRIPVEWRSECQEMLEGLRSVFTHAINENLSLKFMPHLEFHFDDSIEQGEHMSEIFKQLAAEQKNS